ncbi:MAG: pyruvate ferredoxin oxidoreductase [Thermoleophilia bacterium]|jgi:pyruvate/2-oxoacid:ferredoxin oxidoreductase alpha subunit|nr:pyruvate ferredoxin oxidoreductase [Thermoleophilia bacterium]
MTTADGTRMLLTGNHAVSYGAMLSRPEVVPIYPITPQTPIAEKISELQLSGQFDVDIMTAESEHSAMSACITASLTGVRVFTATASQGLLLMHEMLHYASGARAPIVMAEVNRTLGSPWGFWPDQSDSLSQRDTSWIQFYCEHGQESLDTVIQAFRVAEELLLPAMVIHEAFYVSHALEPVVVPTQERVDEYLPPFNPIHRLDTQLGESWGNVVNQDMFYRHRKALTESMALVPDAAINADADYQRMFGRGYGILERYRMDGAETAIVGFGSMCGTARVAVDTLRDAGHAVGLLKIKLFNPFPIGHVRQAVAGVPKLVVIERNVSPGIGGVLGQTLKSALYGMADPPAVHSYLAGVGGVNVSARTLVEMITKAMADEPVAESVWQR